MSDPVELHNRRNLWIDVERQLDAARHSIEQAQAALEDLRASDWADALQPIVDQLRAAVIESIERRERER